MLASGILVAAVLYGIVPGIVKVGGWFELLFVNTLGMSFNTGVIVYIILLAACLIWGIYESYTERNKARMALSFILTIAMLGIPFYGHGTSSVVIGVIVIAALWLYLRPKTQAAVKEKFRVSARTLNTSLLCTMMIVIGYSSYALIVIRSTANTPMDQNSPEDIFTLGEIPGTRAVWHTPAVLWPCLLLASGTGRERRLLRTAHQSTTARSSSARRKLRPTKEFVHRNPRTH